MENAARSTVFKSGRSDAVRIPAGVRLKPGTKAVYIRKDGNSLIITPVENQWDAFFNMQKLGDDFMPDREQGEFTEREQV